MLKRQRFFFKVLGLEGNFDASSRWLYRFKQRHGICELDIHAKGTQRWCTLSGDKDAAEKFVAEFNNFVTAENLLPEQIFNVDESDLYWKCLPSKTLAFKKEKSAPGHKSSKERLTIMTCSNVTGSKKLKLLVIGKANKPRSFKGTKVKNLSVHYFNQKKGWMNQVIFQEWFTKNFISQVRDFLVKKPS